MHIAKGVAEQLGILALGSLVGECARYGLAVRVDERLDFGVELVVVVDHAEDEIVAAVEHAQLLAHRLARHTRQTVHAVLARHVVHVLGVAVQRLHVTRVHEAHQVLDALRRPTRAYDEHVDYARVAACVAIVVGGERGRPRHGRHRVPLVFVVVVFARLVLNAAVAVVVVVYV